MIRIHSIAHARLIAEQLRIRKVDGAANGRLVLPLLARQEAVPIPPRTYGAAVDLGKGGHAVTGRGEPGVAAARGDETRTVVMVDGEFEDHG